MSLLLGLLLVGTACAGGSTPNTSTNAPIILGDTGSQTGFMAPYDQEASNAALLAVDAINAKGGVMGRPLKILHVDSRSDIPTNSSAAVQLIGQGAVAILSSCDYDFGGPSARVAGQHKMVAISLCASDTKFGVQAIGPYAFTMGTATNTLSAIMAEFAFNTQGYRSVWLLVDQSLEYTKTLGSYFVTRWSQLAGAGSILGQETFGQGDLSIAAQIGRYQSLPTKPDFIWMPSYVPGGGTALRQLRAAGINVPVLSADGMEGTNLTSTAGSNVTGLYATMYGFWVVGAVNNVEPAVDEIAGEYVKKFGQSPISGYFLPGYASVQAMAMAMTQCQCTDGPGMTKALESFKDVVLAGVLNTTYTATAHYPSDRSMSLWTIGGGKYTFITRVKPQQVPPAPA